MDFFVQVFFNLFKQIQQLTHFSHPPPLHPGSQHMYNSDDFMYPRYRQIHNDRNDDLIFFNMC